MKIGSQRVWEREIVTRSSSPRGIASNCRSRRRSRRRNRRRSNHGELRAQSRLDDETIARKEQNGPRQLQTTRFRPDKRKACLLRRKRRGKRVIRVAVARDSAFIARWGLFRGNLDEIMSHFRATETRRGERSHPGRRRQSRRTRRRGCDTRKAAHVSGEDREDRMGKKNGGGGQRGFCVGVVRSITRSIYSTLRRKVRRSKRSGFACCRTVKIWKF